MRRIVMASVASQTLLLFYLEIVEWADLFPWNDVRRGNGQPGLDIALGLVMVGAIIASSRRWRFGMIGAALIYALWLALQIMTFWTAYASGASPQWQQIYEKNFAATVQWLPAWGSHLPPDANHLVLQGLILVAFVTTAAAAVRLRRGPRSR